MNTAEQILVIILASALSLFLILSIIAAVSLIRLTKKMNAIADAAQEVITKAHDIADKVEDVSDIFKKTAGPLALGKYFMNIVETVSKHKKGK